MNDYQEYQVSEENAEKDPDLNIETIQNDSKTRTRLNWYALYTKPRAEKRVDEKLKTRGIESYLPLHRSPRVWSDRVKIVDIPLFNSYIFVRCRKSEILYMNKICGVARIVFYDGKPAIIRQNEIDSIKTFIKKASGKALCKGDEVEILTGSMKNISGKIVRIKKKYLLLHIQQLMATVCVDMENVAPTNRIK
ncbi:MAG: UpxY family transcription antiterminator [Tannerella sp.]|jgi:transcription antitermination factor NusG|nr:UpxY family transcription antiterminator [Tannerella sp.]